MSDNLSARQLEAKKNRLINKANRLLVEEKLSPELKKQIESKIKEVDVAIARQVKEEVKGLDPKRIKGVTEHIDTKTPYMKEVSGDEFSRKIKASTGKNKPSRYGAAKKIVKGGKKMRSMIPGIGLGLAAMNILSAPSAQAGEVAMEEVQQGVTDLVPGGVDKLGPQEGTPESVMEDPSASPEARRRAAELLKKRLGTK